MRELITHYACVRNRAAVEYSNWAAFSALNPVARHLPSIEMFQLS